MVAKHYFIGGFIGAIIVLMAFVLGIPLALAIESDQDA